MSYNKQPGLSELLEGRNLLWRTFNFSSRNFTKVFRQRPLLFHLAFYSSLFLRTRLRYSRSALCDVSRYGSKIMHQTEAKVIVEFRRCDLSLSLGLGTAAVKGDDLLRVFFSPQLHHILFSHLLQSCDHEVLVFMATRLLAVFFGVECVEFLKLISSNVG